MRSVEELKQIHFDATTGYGLMGLTWRADPLSEKQAFDAIDEAIKLSSNVAIFNVGEFYGPDFKNLKLVRDYFASHPDLRDRVIISCKGGIDAATLTPKGDYASISQSIKNCVEHIGGPIEIFEPARIDKAIAGDKCFAHETFDCIVDHIKKGDIGGISLSEVDAEQIRAIYADYSKYICCVEVELSLFSRDILSNGVLDACNELRIPVICYSPLGRGLLTGKVQNNEDIPEGDFRKILKRFQGDSMKQNLLLVKFLQDEIVSKRQDGITLPQVALAWIRSLNKRYPNTKIIPLPGGSQDSRVKENMTIFELSQQELDKLDNFLQGFTTIGGRYEFV